MSSSTVTYLDPVQLATLIREQAPLPPDQRSLLVLDVRDDDFPGGNIAGAVNFPSGEWNDTALQEFVQQRLTGTPVQHVVVHCMFSQQRGPRCAMRLARYLEEAGRGGTPRVSVLRGGWQGFYRHAYSEPDLVAAVATDDG